MNRYTPAAASLAILVAIVALLIPTPGSKVYAGPPEVMVPDGGRLDALDEEGNILGPCPLKHTDVKAQISGFISRVTLTQTYRNDYETKIEAVYTFPMSHRAAVDRMIMTVGDRVVIGEVKERELARRIYEAARSQGYVASLLEQERPNIFTQSIANIEPGAEVVVEISYVELLQSRDGTYSFNFPMVVGPRYIPGSQTISPALTPAELKLRHGLVLLGPAKFTLGEAGKVSELGTLQTGKLNTLLTAAQPIMSPAASWWENKPKQQPELWYNFEVQYCDGSKERGTLHTDGTGQLNNRWLYTDPQKIEGMGTGFSPDTDQVPDASRITPEPVRPGTRAGHDISITVTIDTGGPGLLDVKSELHKVVQRKMDVREVDNLPRRLTLALEKRNEIPNRDFALSWRQTDDAIQEATFVHTSEKHAEDGGFFTLILQPPARVKDADVPPRELIFVMDTSGSMSGFPIEKSKEVMTRAIDAMRADDTFNVITFAGYTSILWDKPRPASEANRLEAKRLVESRQGGGGTEMMKAINAALVQTAGSGQPIPRPLGPADLANLPADGRQVEVVVPYKSIEMALPAKGIGWPYRIRVRDDLAIGLRLSAELPTVLQPDGVNVVINGAWRIQNGQRELVAARAKLDNDKPTSKIGPMRIVLFLTDGYVGNDMAIIDAIKKNAHTTRVFSFGIGNSVNRYLLEGMARAGRGEAEFVYLSSDPDEAVERFARRVQTPVLMDIEVEFSDGLKVTEVIPGLEKGVIPDLFDAKPLVILGRYTTPGRGTVTIRGNTGSGRYERVLDLEFPETEAEHDVIATVWARSKVEKLMNQDLAAAQHGAFPEQLKQQVIALGEQFQIMTQFTSFVAVEKSRVTIEGKPMLVAVPIEMPEGVSYEGVFGGEFGNDVKEPMLLGAQLQVLQSSAETLGKSSFPWQGGRRRAGNAPAPGMPWSMSSSRRAPSPMRRAPTATKLGGGIGVGSSRRGGSAGVNMNTANGFVFGEPADAAETTSLYHAGYPRQNALSILQADTDGDGKPDAIFVGNDEERLKELKDVLGRVEEDRRADDAKAGTSPVFSQIPLVEKFFKQPAQPVPYVNNRPIFAEHVAIVIGVLVKDGEVDEAKSLAERFAEAKPDYEIAVAMRDTFANDGLNDAERDAKIAELAEQARQTIRGVIAEARRQARLKRILDPVLLELVRNPENLAIAKDVKILHRGALLSILVKQIDDETLKALEDLGLTVEDTSKSINLVVGTASVLKLEKLALLEQVRRIEPTRAD